MMRDLFSYWFTLLLRPEGSGVRLWHVLRSSAREPGDETARAQGRAPLEAEDAALAVERARLSHLLDLCTGSRAAVEEPTSRIRRANAELTRSTGRAAWLFTMVGRAQSWVG